MSPRGGPPIVLGVKIVVLAPSGAQRELLQYFLGHRACPENVHTPPPPQKELEFPGGLDIGSS